MTTYERPDINEIVEYNGKDVAIRDLPSQNLRASYGYGHFAEDIKFRKVVSNPDENWEFTPDKCLEADNYLAGKIINDEIACRGCGLDFT